MFAVFIFHRSNNNGTASAVLNYNSKSNSTVGYVLIGPRLSVEDICRELGSQFPRFSHPLVVPTVLLEFTSADLMKELQSIHWCLAKSEEKTRFGDWEMEDDVAVGADGALTVSPTPDPIGLVPIDSTMIMKSTTKKTRYWKMTEEAMDDCHNVHDLSRILGTINCRFAFMEVAVRCCISMASHILGELENHNLSNDAPAASSGALQQMDSRLKDLPLKNRVKLLASDLDHISMFGAIRQRMQAQQSTVSSTHARPRLVFFEE